MTVKVSVQDAVRQLKFIYRFGQTSAEDMLRRLYGDGNVAELTIPGLAAPIRIRKNTSDLPTFEQIFVEQQYLFRINRFNPEYIIDGGANTGISTVFFANRYPHAKIVAIEPEPSNYALLVQNTAPYGNITPLHAALWNRKTSLAISNPHAEKNAFRIQAAAATDNSNIPALSPADIMETTGFPRLDILKLDIEGAEKELFEENSGLWLDKTDVIIIELHDWIRNGCAASFYKAITPYGFSQINSGENALVRLGNAGFIADAE
jgi:FkbM family methyltransferase